MLSVRFFRTRALRGRWHFFLGMFNFQKLVILFLLYPSFVASYTVFDPTCDSPPQNTNIVNSSNIRGTFDILWSCLSVLVTCIWAIQHLSVEEDDRSEGDGFADAMKHKAWRNWTKSKWTVLTIATPEYILSKALAETLAAFYSNKQFEAARMRLENENWNDWSTTHAYFANMRGFILEFDVAAVPTPDLPAKASKLGNSRQLPRGKSPVPYKEQNAQIAMAIELGMCRAICGNPCRNQEAVEDPDGTPLSPLRRPRGFSPTNRRRARPRELNVFEKLLQWIMLRRRTNAQQCAEPVDPKPIAMDKVLQQLEALELDNLNKMGRRTETLRAELGHHKHFSASWALNASQMLYACEQRIIPGPPNITARELSDRSKGDMFVKLAAAFQILWLVIQISARSAQGLAIALMEVTVLAFAACSITTYVLLIPKPQDVHIPIVVRASQTLTRKNIIGLAARSSPSTMAVHEFWLRGVAIRDQADNVFPYSPGLPLWIPKLTKREDAFYLDTTISGIGIAGTIFGSIHCAAWNFDFPTPTEQLLWRVSCLIILIMPLAGAVTYATIRHEAKKRGTEDNETNLWLKPLGYALVPVYLLARAFLTVETFRELAYLPPSAYATVNWPSWIPHVVWWIRLDFFGIQSIV